MANEIQTAPSTTLADNDDWEQELNLRELSMKGYDGISLTEWASGDTDRPQIAAGSVIEIDGAIAKFTNQTAITDEGGIADGWCYIKFVVSGADVTPTLTNTFGTWDTAKQGFYSGNDRYSIFRMYRSGAVTKIYTHKEERIANQTNIMQIGYRDGYPGDGGTLATMYNELSPYLTNINDRIYLSGSVLSTNTYILASAYRYDASTILAKCNTGGGASGTLTLTAGSAITALAKYWWLYPNTWG